MRTTVEFPGELFRRAKARAAARGESLKTLMVRALTAEVGQSQEGARRRVSLPLFGDAGKPPVTLHGSDLERALADDDAMRLDRSRGSRNFKHTRRKR